MTAANILLYVALIGYVLYLKMQGRPLKQGRRLFVLPVVMVVIGFADLSDGHLKPIAITITVVGAIVSLALGALRGRADELFTRDGTAFVRWTRLSLALFAANIVAKLVLDLIGIAAGSTASAAGKSLIFTLGLTLLAEAIVLLVRYGGAADLLSQPGATTTQSNNGTRVPHRQTDQHAKPAPAPASNPSSTQSLVEAVERHHQAHRERHHHHDHDHHRRG